VALGAAGRQRVVVYPCRQVGSSGACSGSRVRE
jgi:hypothetical protein